MEPEQSSESLGNCTNFLCLEIYPYPSNRNGYFNSFKYFIYKITGIKYKVVKDRKTDVCTLRMSQISQIELSYFPVSIGQKK